MSNFASVEELVEYIKEFDIEDYNYDRTYYVPSLCDTMVVDQSFIVGGVEGGSCWESSNPQPFTTDKVYTLEKGRLFSFVEEHLPGITFFQFMRLKSEVLSSKRYEESEYYGNCTIYESWYIDCQKLFDFIVTEEHE